MNNKKLLLITIILEVVFSSCTPTAPIPTPTPTPTPLPTATPAPEPITGTIFWDANGSGLQDETSFIIPDFDPSDPPYFFELLAANDTGLGNLSPGELATVPEPPVSGIGVCLGDICAETGVDGSFALQPDKVQDTYNLKFSDPHADDPAHAFRYVNKWNESVVIESYEINGVTVPEQHLNDTETVDISRVMQLDSSSEISIGLVQGVLSSPFYQNTDHEIRGWYDLDPDENKVRNWRLETKKIITPEFNIGIYDTHDGIDFYAPEGSFIVASTNGYVSFADYNETGFAGYSPAQVVEIENNNLIAHSGHVDTILVEKNQKVFRGQIIAIVGKTGSSWIHLHFSLRVDGTGRRNPNIHFETRNSRNFDAFRDSSNENSISFWSVDNLILYPLVEIIK